MDTHRFDALTRALSTSRRGTLKTLLGGAFGALLASHAEDVTAGCKKPGRKCDKNKDCCDGARCKGDKKDKKGKCRCKSGLKVCPGEKTCTKLDSDLNHCGSCGNQCVAGEACCDGVCADLESNHDNCGSCGQACGPTETCFAKVCVTAEGCPAGADACAGPMVVCGSNGKRGFCFASATPGNPSYCGEITICDSECSQDTDCEPDFGAGAACVVCRLPACGLGNLCAVPAQ